MDQDQQTTPTNPVQAPAPAPSPSSGPAPINDPSNNGSGQNKKIIIAIAVVAALLIGGIAYAATQGSDDKKTSNNSSQNENKETEAEEEEKSSNNAVTAERYSDFDAVCAGGSVMNAATFNKSAKPYKVASFSKNPKRTSFSTESVGYDTAYYVDSKTDVSTISTVACLETVAGSENKELDCDYEKDGATINVAYYSSKRKLTFYSAKDGKKVGDGGEINAPALKCPSFLSYDKETMSAYASVDDASLEAAISKFAL